MTFSDFWASELGRGTPDTDGRRELAQAAWDAALCAATAEAFDHGRAKTNHQILAAISAAHTWVKPETSTL